MMEFGEGLWYIITSGHKESQHFYICASIYFKRKTNVRNRKEIKKRKKNNLPEAWLLQPTWRPSPLGAAPSSTSCQ